MIISRDYVNALKTGKKLPFPLLVQLEITEECPFHCTQCYKKSSANYHMDYKRLTTLIDDCYQKGTRFFVLNGGEPLLYRHIIELIKWIKKYDVNLNCFTSGAGLTNEVIEAWDFVNHRLFISLNGSTEEINGRTREGYGVSIAAVEKLSDGQYQFGINWVARRDNICDFMNLVDLCERYSVKWLFITSEKLTGSECLMSPLQKEDMLYLKEMIDQYHGSVELIVESCFPNLDMILVRNKSNCFMGCFAGRYGCCVNMDFRFSPCTHLPFAESYVSLEEYWEKSEYIQIINSHRTVGRCYQCTFHNRCSPCYAWNSDMSQRLIQDYKECPLFAER